MNRVIWAGVVAALMLPGAAGAQKGGSTGTEEFGMSPKELVQTIERVEELISKCMREQGFQYIAADHETVRAGMAADKTLPGVSEDEFVAKHGFGVTTFYTGEPPQLSNGYSPARVGLGDRNVQYFKSLSSADQVAYNHALLGSNNGITFAVALETENVSVTGGCTRKAVEQVFKPEHLKASYYNPINEQINKHPQMRWALRYYANEMKKAGFEYSHPDQIEPDLRARLAALTSGGTIPVEKMTAEQKAALKQLQDFERAVAKVSFEISEGTIKQIEEKILEEMFARKPQ